ncbi:MAG TPA: polysaccharide deacetylase family protein [Bacillales bacterium]|nr:polysaccharide deacetylase family protein [Bacillales bacterium]
MKKRLLIGCAVLLLAGCSSSSQTQSSHPDPPDKMRKNEQLAEKTAPKKTEQPTQHDEKKQPDVKKEPKEIHPQYRMTKNYYLKPIDQADPKVVLLTIDDAPDEHAVEMAKTLKKLHAKAIFFVNGMYVKDDEGLNKLKKIEALGFPVGNHTVTHPNLSDLSPEEQRKEILPVYETLQRTSGKPVKFFRAPHGVNTKVSDQLAKERNVLVMNWSYGYDWHKQYENPEALAKIMITTPYLHNGSILLMHDRSWTAEALPEIVKGLRAKGYTIVDPERIETPLTQKNKE